MTPKTATLGKVIHQVIYMDGNEYGSPLMDKIAAEWLDEHRYLVTPDIGICVIVFEHAGWFLGYTLGTNDKQLCISSANDGAIYHGEASEWRLSVKEATWDYLPEIRRQTFASHNGTGF